MWNRVNPYVYSKLVLQHMRKVQHLFTLEPVAMVTPDQMSYNFSETWFKPCSEVKTCPRVPSQVGMVGRNMLPLLAQRNTGLHWEWVRLRWFLDFDTWKGETYHWFRLNRTVITTDEVSAKLMCMSEKWVTFRYEEQLWTADLSETFAKTFSLSLMIWLSYEKKNDKCMFGNIQK